MASHSSPLPPPGVPLSADTVWLVNSAMMPAPGVYDYWRLTPDEFARAVRQAHDDGSLESCIGYEETANIIEQLSGIRPEVSREPARLEPGDVMLVIKLRYRLRDPQQKGGSKPALEDFEFGIVFYRDPEECGGEE